MKKVLLFISILFTFFLVLNVNTSKAQSFESICQKKSWTCQECQVAPNEGDGVCESDKTSYCADVYGCRGTQRPIVSDGEFAAYTKEWVCENTCKPVVSFSLSGADAQCTGDFEVKATIKEDDVVKEGIEVTFNYKTEQKTDSTNNKGEAAVTYGWGGVYEVTAYAPNYGSASKTASHRDDCVGEEQEGEVLGATIMAETGTTDDLIGIVFTAGALLTAIGIRPYRTKKSK